VALKKERTLATYVQRWGE